MKNNRFRIAAVFMLLVTFAISTLAQSKAFDTSRMDTSIDACEDFFGYANGTWVKKTEIPPAFSRWGTFNILADNNQAILKDILERAAKTRSPKGSDAQLIGDMYSSCMDEAAIEKADSKPLMSRLKMIDSIKTPQEIPALIASFHQIGVPMFFGFGAGPDLKNSSMNMANASQGGLALSNRDFYDNKDAKSVEIREKFVAYMTNMFKLLGDSPETAAANAKASMAVQMRLAMASKRPVELRNPDARYNKIKTSDANAITTNLSWEKYMTARGVTPVNEINFGQPDFFKEFNNMLTDQPLNDLKAYMRFMVVNSSASRLSKRFVDENFDFYSRTLQGTKEQQPRWKRCVGTVDGTLGEALGMEYVKDNFKPETKKRADEMIDQLFIAMGQRIDALAWMSAETKVQAKKKLGTFKKKIGYPDKLRGYAGLSLSRKSYFENAANVSAFNVKRNLADINKPVDRTRWGFSTPTINASYNPINNEITFPAGILQPPFFSFTADDAINYGGIGGVIGHEISHGFDDSGSRFDSEGNLKMWWTPDDRKSFEERADCVVDQFNKYEVQPNTFINGRLTLGENIGDLGGLEVSYTAFQNSMKGKQRPANIDGFTPEQRFFLGWAQVWATKSTPEFEINQTKTDPHANARYRVNGPLSNMNEFAQAFGCKLPNKMVRQKQCEIW
ncbi:MAG TPA: M13 family metallopeptidase [Pyrinomonadaceae bacterium]|nr:M13 family metallopeptidase [Pyrinomonadaceae bacterium]